MELILSEDGDCFELMHHNVTADYFIPLIYQCCDSTEYYSLLSTLQVLGVLSSSTPILFYGKMTYAKRGPTFCSSVD